MGLDNLYRVLDANVERKLESIKGAGNRLILRRPFDDADAAITAAFEVQRLHKMGIPYEEIAVLMRTRALTRVWNGNLPPGIYNTTSLGVYLSSLAVK